MGKQQVMKTFYRLAPGYTVIDEDNRTLFIDYDSGQLYNLSKQSLVCSSFGLSASELQDDFVAAQAGIFAEIKSVAERTEPAGTGDSLLFQTVLYAPRALLNKRVVEAHFDQFGMTFVPGAVEFLVDRKGTDFTEFAEMARNNALGKELNPLIYRLDISHSITRFGGLPVRSKGQELVTEYHFSFEEKKALHQLQQKRCPGQ